MSSLHWQAGKALRPAFPSFCENYSLVSFSAGLASVHKIGGAVLPLLNPLLGSRGRRGSPFSLSTTRAKQIQVDI